MSVGGSRIEVNGLLSRRASPGKGFLFGHDAKFTQQVIGISQTDICWDEVLILYDRLGEIIDRLIEVLGGSFVPIIAPFEIELFRGRGIAMIIGDCHVALTVRQNSEGE